MNSSTHHFWLRNAVHQHRKLQRGEEAARLDDTRRVAHAALDAVAGRAAGRRIEAERPGLGHAVVLHVVLLHALAEARGPGQQMVSSANIATTHHSFRGSFSAVSTPIVATK